MPSSGYGVILVLLMVFEDEFDGLMRVFSKWLMKIFNAVKKKCCQRQKGVSGDTVAKNLRSYVATHRYGDDNLDIYDPKPEQRKERFKAYGLSRLPRYGRN